MALSKSTQQHTKPQWARNRPQAVLFAQIEKSGDLQTADARLLVEALHARRFSGTLSLELRDKKKKLWFFKGEVFRLQSNLVPELLGQMMIDRHWLTDAELKECLDLQRDENTNPRRIGEIIQEVVQIDVDEIEALIDQQSLYSFLQALTWRQGKYQIHELALKTEQRPILHHEEALRFLQSILSTDLDTQALDSVRQRLEGWRPDRQAVELSQTPLWSILAECRYQNLNGVLSIRRQNKLFEIVLKYGVPLTLFEGSFGQPRQTILVRQASAEHEKFFVEQLFGLFSFLSGNVYFRLLGDQPSQKDEKSEQRELTAVTQSVRPEEIPVLLEDEIKDLVPFHKAFMRRTQNRIRHVLYKIKKQTQKLFLRFKHQSRSP